MVNSAESKLISVGFVVQQSIFTVEVLISKTVKYLKHVKRSQSKSSINVFLIYAVFFLNM